jgi:hypothetical protein
MRGIISQARLHPHELEEVVTALGCSRYDGSFALLLEIAGADGSGLRHNAKEWIDAVVEIGGVDSERLLLSFVDPDAAAFTGDVSLGDYVCDTLATHVTRLAQADVGVAERIRRLCGMQLSPARRILLSKVTARMATEATLCAALDLIDDNAKPRVPYELWKALETAFLEHRPVPNRENSYTLVPRSSNAVRAKLFHMLATDARRRQSAFALLGELEAWRLEYGRPTGEPRHPAFEYGELNWALLEKGLA